MRIQMGGELLNAAECSRRSAFGDQSRKEIDVTGCLIMHHIFIR